MPLLKYKSGDKKTITREGIDIHIVTLKKKLVAKTGSSLFKKI